MLTIALNENARVNVRPGVVIIPAQSVDQHLRSFTMILMVQTNDHCAEKEVLLIGILKECLLTQVGSVGSSSCQRIFALCIRDKDDTHHPIFGSGSSQTTLRTKVDRSIDALRTKRIA